MIVSVHHSKGLSTFTTIFQTSRDRCTSWPPVSTRSGATSRGRHCCHSPRYWTLWTVATSVYQIRGHIKGKTLLPFPQVLASGHQCLPDQGPHQGEDTATLPPGTRRCSPCTRYCRSPYSPRAPGSDLGPYFGLDLGPELKPKPGPDLGLDLELNPRDGTLGPWNRLGPEPVARPETGFLKGFITNKRLQCKGKYYSRGPECKVFSSLYLTSPERGGRG